MKNIWYYLFMVATYFNSLSPMEIQKPSLMKERGIREITNKPTSLFLKAVALHAKANSSTKKTDNSAQSILSKPILLEKVIKYRNYECFYPEFVKFLPKETSSGVSIEYKRRELNQRMYDIVYEFPDSSDKDSGKEENERCKTRLEHKEQYGYWPLSFDEEGSKPRKRYTHYFQSNYFDRCRKLCIDKNSAFKDPKQQLFDCILEGRVQEAKALQQKRRFSYEDLFELVVNEDEFFNNDDVCKIIKFFIEECCMSPNMKDINGLPLIFEAIIHARTPLIEYLIKEHKVDSTQKLPKYYDDNPLMAIVGKDHKDYSKLFKCVLRNQEVSQELKNKLLHEAVRLFCWDHAKILLKFGADIKSKINNETMFEKLDGVLDFFDKSRGSEKKYMLTRLERKLIKTEKNQSGQIRCNHCAEFKDASKVTIANYATLTFMCKNKTHD